MDWRDEWWAASTGPAGFWWHEAAAQHFRTSAGERRDPAGTEEMIRVLLDTIDRPPGSPPAADSRPTAPATPAAPTPAVLMPATPTPRTGPPDTARGTTPIIGLVDLGAGDGSLLRAVAAARPDWSLLGVDVRQAPSDLPPGCSWRRAVWDVRSASWTGPSGPLGRPPWHDLATRGPVMVVAHEWLDELPCRIAQRTADGWELLGPDGPTGDRAAADELAWLTEWAGAARGVEVGLTRDRAWAAVASALPHGGILVAVDYGHRRADRPPEGGLIGYRDGRRVPPVPDRRTNLSAPVAVDALAAAIESLPRVRRHTIARQHELVSRPAPAAPRAPLAALVAANRRRALADPDRWGANWWLVHTVDAGNGSATS